MLGWFMTAGGVRPPLGRVETFNGTPALFERGFHASAQLLDALEYATGNTLQRIELMGTVVNGEDRACSTVCRELWRIDATPILRDFARWIASGMVLAYWPDAPDVVRRWLATGEEWLKPSIPEAASGALNIYSNRGTAARAVKRAATAKSAWMAAQDVVRLAEDVVAREAKKRGPSPVFAKKKARQTMNAHLEELAEQAARPKEERKWSIRSLWEWMLR